MKLKNSLYTIVEISPEAKSAKIELLRDCAIYKAHFPEQPITPGVCIIQTASELLEETIGQRVSLDEVVNAKFLSVINPDKTTLLEYNFQKLTDLSDSLIKASVIVADSETTYAKLSLIYTKF